MSDEDEDTLLIFQTSGIDTPKRTYAPLFFATTAAAMDIETTMWFTMGGVTQLKKGNAEKVELVEGSGVTLKTWLDRALEAGVRICACHQALEVENWTREDLIDGVEIIGAASVIDMCFEAGHVMYF